MISRAQDRCRYHCVGGDRRNLSDPLEEPDDHAHRLEAYVKGPVKSSPTGRNGLISRMERVARFTWVTARLLGGDGADGTSRGVAAHTSRSRTGPVTVKGAEAGGNLFTQSS